MPICLAISDLLIPSRTNRRASAATAASDLTNFPRLKTPRKMVAHVRHTASHYSIDLMEVTEPKTDRGSANRRWQTGYPHDFATQNWPTLII